MPAYASEFLAAVFRKSGNQALNLIRHRSNTIVVFYLIPIRMMKIRNSALSLLPSAGVDKNVDGAMHFVYSHKYNTISAEDSSDMN